MSNSPAAYSIFTFSLGILWFSAGWVDCCWAIGLDSRAIKDGDIFVAVVGHAVDGRQFIDKTFSRREETRHCTSWRWQSSWLGWWLNAVPVVYVSDLNSALSELMARVYSSQATKLISVTGTNGKTCSWLIAQWLDLVGQRSGERNTGNGFLDNLNHC